MTVKKKSASKRQRTTDHIITVALQNGKDPDVTFVHDKFSLRVSLKSIGHISVTPITGTKRAILRLTLVKDSCVSNLQLTADYDTCMRAVHDFNVLIGLDDDE